MSFKGMWSDGEPEIQPEGTYRIAINAVKEPNEAALSTEPSNILLSNLKGKLVGVIPIDGESAVLFCSPGYIYLYNQTNKTTTLLKDIPELNLIYPIQGKHKFVNGCENVVYWNDGVNEDRYYNLDTGTFDTVDDFRLIPTATYPITTFTITNTGQLKKGSYFFVLELLDNALNVLIKTIPSQPVDILEDNQGIDLFIDNLKDISFIRISVIQYTSGNGIVLDAYQYEDVINITGTSLTFSYTGSNVFGTDFKSLLSTGVFYDTSRYMEVAHGRLLRGNLSEKSYDYSEFQKKASKIKTNYAIKETSDNIFTEQGDEVKAYGIVYLMKNGSLSPVFHIPGRRIKDSDKVEITDIDGINKVPKWKLHDTSDSNTKELGYYQSDEKYVDPVNFCGTDYWGVDADGYSLKDTNVRYHKIPSREKEWLISQTDALAKRYIGITFSNVEYPNNDVVGHFFVTASAKTVLSSGYLLPFNDEDKSKENKTYNDKIEGRYIHSLPHKKDNNEVFYNTVKQNFISPYILSDKKKIEPSYIKVNGEVERRYEDYRPFFENYFTDKLDLQLFVKLHMFKSTFDSFSEILKVNESEVIPYKTSVYKEYSNRSLNSTMNLMTLDKVPAKFNNTSANMRYVYAKTNNKVFQSLSAIRYHFMNSSPLTSSSETLFSGDVKISRFNIVNVSRAFPDTNNNLKFPFAGFNIFSTGLLLGGADKQINFEVEFIENLYFESNYSFETINNEYYYGQNYQKAITLDPLLNKDAKIDFITKLIATEQFVGGETERTVKESINEIRYDVNKDIGVIANQRVTYPLPISFNYCSDCRGHYPNRIIFSDVNSQEQQSDSWRVYPSLNYQDLPGHRGAVTAFDYTGGVLVVRMNRGLFMLQPDPQRIEMTGANLYLGNPQFLGVPAQEIATDASGYGGQQDRLASVVTPSGLFWYDEDAGKVFGYSGQVQELSRNGMYNFFAKDFPESQFTQLSYDPYYERVIIHRKSIVNEIVHSFTVSYSMVAKSWVSFHSYNPDYMFYLNKTFYTSYNKELYTHNNKYNFCNFYGKDYYFQVGLTYVNMQTSQWHSVHYYAPVFKYENNKWTDVLDKTFNKAFAFTRKQCTGLVDLLLTKDPTEIITWNEKTKTVVQADRNYRIGGLRDMSVADGILSSDWNDINSFYNGEQGYQDVVPTNIDFNKPQHEQLMFRDKFIQLRLLFNANEYKMLIYITDYTKLPQIR